MAACFAWFNFEQIYGIDYKKVLLEEPPHIKSANPAVHFTTQQGKGYILPLFYHRPVLWVKKLYVSAFCIFDDKDRLVDVFAHGFEETPSFWCRVRGPASLKIILYRKTFVLRSVGAASHRAHGSPT